MSDYRVFLLGHDFRAWWSGQQAPGRLEQIQDEWRLNTPGKVAERDPALFELLTNGQFDLPTILPDGII